MRVRAISVLALLLVVGGCSGDTLSGRFVWPRDMNVQTGIHVVGSSATDLWGINSVPAVVHWDGTSWSKVLDLQTYTAKLASGGAGFAWLADVDRATHRARVLKLTPTGIIEDHSADLGQQPPPDALPTIDIVGRNGAVFVLYASAGTPLVRALYHLVGGRLVLIGGDQSATSLGGGPLHGNAVVSDDEAYFVDGASVLHYRGGTMRAVPGLLGSGVVWSSPEDVWIAAGLVAIRGDGDAFATVQLQEPRSSLHLGTPIARTATQLLMFAAESPNWNDPNQDQTLFALRYDDSGKLVGESRLCVAHTAKYHDDWLGTTDVPVVVDDGTLLVPVAMQGSSVIWAVGKP